MKYRALVLGLLTLATVSASRADLIGLSDGRKISGTMVRNGDVMTIKSDDGKVLNVNPSDIASVTLTSTLTPEEIAATDWDRLTSQARATDAFPALLDLYQKFLDKYPAGKRSDDARKTLAIYQAMAEKDPVKFRGRWMPRGQVDVVIKQWTDAARPALDLYKAGRLKETLETLTPVLAADGQNPDALTLAGLANYRLNNLNAARTQFAALAAADPSSLLAENNLAVIASAQKLMGEAFIHYTKALQIMPDHRLLLDNVAEALNSYLAAGGDKSGTAYRALLKAYEPAESRMEATMARPADKGTAGDNGGAGAGGGMVRWGSTWVTADQKAKLQQAQASIQDMMGRLDAQYAGIRKTLATIDGQIRQAQTDIDNYNSTIGTCTAQILTAQAGGMLDVSFYVAQRDVAVQDLNRVTSYKTQLQAEYDQLVAGTRDYIAQVEKFKASFSMGGVAGQYTGTQRIIDLGETDKPPAPAPVADPVVPTLAPPTIVVSPPPAPTPPVLVPMPTGTPAFVPVTPVRGGH